MIVQIFVLLKLLGTIKTEERLSWFTTDTEIKRNIFVPDNLSEGKEENRVLPWVFHDNETLKIIQLKCIMRGYNATNNPSDYQDVRWSHPGFSDSQVITNSTSEEGEENGAKYRIWTIEIKATAADAGKKWATCEFQQGDFPLSTDFQFLIFRKLSEEENLVVYDFGEVNYQKDVTKQIEDSIKRQISENHTRRVASFATLMDKKVIKIRFFSNSKIKLTSDWKQMLLVILCILLEWTVKAVLFLFCYTLGYLIFLSLFCKKIEKLPK